jgi:hypothetical protein
MTDDERLGPPPVEPLSEAAWARVERGVWAQLDADTAPIRVPPGPRRRWAVAAPLVAAAAVAALVVMTRGRPTTRSDEPSRVVSGIAPSSVSFGDSHIELDAATAMVMSHEAEHPTVLLERGAAWFTVAPRLQRPAFIVHAGDATVRVVGTRFRVGRSEERIAVEVDRGLVDVQFRGSVVAVGAGQRWSSETPSRIAAIGAIAAPPPPEPVVGEVPASEVPDMALPEAPAPAPRHEPRPPRASASPGRAEPRPGAARPTASDPADPGTPGPVDRDRAEYDRLAALEPRSPDAALAGYLTLARGTSRWADPALFAAARLAVDRHDRRAETLLGIYLERFPGGANATDARQLLARVQAQQPDRR